MSRKELSPWVALARSLSPAGLPKKGKRERQRRAAKAGRSSADSHLSATAHGAISAMPDARILVVDDEPAVRSIIAAMLARMGYLPTTASGADEALKLLSQDPTYDLVLSDIMMPGVDGITLLDRITTDYPGMP